MATVVFSISLPVRQVSDVTLTILMLNFWLKGIFVTVRAGRFKLSGCLTAPPLLQVKCPLLLYPLEILFLEQNQ